MMRGLVASLGCSRPVSPCHAAAMDAPNGEVTPGDEWQALVYCETCGFIRQTLSGAMGTTADWEVPADATCPGDGCESNRVDVCMILTAETANQKHEMTVVGRGANSRRPVYMLRLGDNFHAAEGKWNNVMQIVNRREDRYVKVILDGGTGEVLRADDHSLKDKDGLDRLRTTGRPQDQA